MVKACRVKLRCERCRGSLPQTRPGGRLWRFCERCAGKLNASPFFRFEKKPQPPAKKTRARPAPLVGQDTEADRVRTRPRSRAVFQKTVLRTIPAPVCIFTAICESDFRMWGGQYLAEMTRIGLPFAVHLDKCNRATKDAFATHPLCIGYTSMDDPRTLFGERHKQTLLDLVCEAGYPWAFALDSDEVFERTGPAHMRQVLAEVEPGVTSVCVRYAHLWDSPQFIRAGHLGLGYREKLVRLDCRLLFCSDIVNGPTRVSEGGARLPYHEAKSERLVVLHYGFISKELRQMHKERWDRIYGAATPEGTNPYGIWRDACDESMPVQVVPNPYL